LLIDFVGRYERLKKDLLAVQERIGVELDLVYINPTANRLRDYRFYYTAETAEMIGEVYRDDIELFGYGFDDFEKK